MPTFKITAEGIHKDEFTVDCSSAEEAISMITSKSHPGPQVKLLKKSEKWVFTIMEGDKVINKLEINYP